MTGEGLHVIVLVDPKSERLTPLQTELGSDLQVEWVPNSGALEGLVGDPARQVEAVVLGPGIGFESALRSAEELNARAPDIGVVLWVDEGGAGQLRRALKAGVLDVVDDTRAPHELREAIDRGIARHRQFHQYEEAGEHDDGGGRVVVVFSSKGGCGKSFISSNLAISLTQRIEGDVGLLDLDLQSGDLALMLQLLPAWSSHDAALQGLRLDGEALRGFLTPHSSGVKLLAAPTDPALSERIDSETVTHLLALMRQSFPVTIVDSPPAFTDPVLAALDVCDEVVLVGSLDVPAIKNLKLALLTLEQLGVGRERMRVVLNRADSSVGLRVQEVERSLGTEVDISVPSSREVPLSVNQGTPLVLSGKRSSVTAALHELADVIIRELDVPGAKDQPQRRFRRRQQKD